ncbi:MAG: YpdA family putative bacillithiol disulfide reductase [Acidobacteriia bacterium]|nr:YpdA family putative bacillithiol disulfide reductase [Terriglobia bacterium]
MTSTLYDVGIIGAGPAGLACGIEATKLELSHVIIEKGCLVNSLAHYPINMVFFTTPELLEIGGLPLISAHEKPTRLEGLKYYRRAVETYHLNVHQYERVEGVSGFNGDFSIRTRERLGQSRSYKARKLIVATGYYDNPNRLGIPGEDLPKVSHYYTEAHPYYDQEVAVIGGRNSAIETALDLFRNDSHVTLIYRGAEFSNSVKYWIKPDIENRVKRGEIKVHFNTQVIAIKPDAVVIQNSNGKVELKNDFVFALTGYRPDESFLRSMGIELSPIDLKPTLHPESFETNVPGVHMAGSIVAGLKNNEIFIENGRFHGKVILQSIARSLRG